MPCLCPRCSPLDIHVLSRSGLNCCEKCGSLYLGPPEKSLPPWVLGVLVILVTNYWLAVY